jgi:ATP-dependent Clp protease ATP-binding subunit ClpA
MSKPKGICKRCARKMNSDFIDGLVKDIRTPELDDMGLGGKLLAMFSSNLDVQDLQEGLESMGGAAVFPFKGWFQEPSVSRSQEPKNERNIFEKTKRNQKKKFIEMYCDVLTKKARAGKLDRVIGREEELERVIHILCRRTKNNPCLMGEPGVGKTAIAEALALRIVSGKVPLRLRGKEICLLDLTALVAGTQFRGQFEARIKGLVDEVKADGNIILFVDEVHNLVGIGDSEGSMNAANILKPALSRGEIQVIGATTFKEYRKYIEKDSALERRFQPVKVVEPSLEKATQLLNGIKEYYEIYHRVKVPENLISRIVVLSERYIMDRFLPDKAIDLLDESCAYTALANKSLENFDKINIEIEEFRAELDSLQSVPQAQTEQNVNEDEKAKVDYERIAKVKCEIAQLTEEAQKIKPKALGGVVTEDEVARVIELWTGIPATKIAQSEFKKLEFLEEKIKGKIKGQDSAVELVCSAIRRNRTRISPKILPASFIFVGPTGVGKTELVKVLSKELFDTPDNLIRLDMSEFMEKHSVSRVIGSPPGYVGYDEAGQVTEKVRQRPYSIVLFDEIEKAHPDILNILLQVLDEGKVTDAHGRVVNFENTVIVMTSNAGSDQKVGVLGFGKNENELNKEKALKSLSEFLRPEFLSRVDEIVVFNSLRKQDLISIARLTLDEFAKHSREKGVEFTYDEKSLIVLVEKLKNDKNGARGIKNLIRKEVEDKLASLIVHSGTFDIGAVRLENENDLQVVKSAT